ncbi:hypothetical protein EVAR_95657_1 [Eumeta japonica]|uniref:Uncharacterized protein n=1 Tax=Eumeta variegata TaxID=151549 RepID=A0A4C1VII7_EUMVA|nr:hypothetical protein EVAR_95657_1 [Eumeta japonica]
MTFHLPYGSDLAPKDFYFLPSVNNKLRGQRFSSREEAGDAIKMHVFGDTSIRMEKELYKLFSAYPKRTGAGRARFHAIRRPQAAAAGLTNLFQGEIRYGIKLQIESICKPHRPRPGGI